MCHTRLQARTEAGGRNGYAVHNQQRKCIQAPSKPFAAAMMNLPLWTYNIITIVMIITTIIIIIIIITILTIII